MSIVSNVPATPVTTGASSPVPQVPAGPVFQRTDIFHLCLIITGLVMLMISATLIADPLYGISSDIIALIFLMIPVVMSNGLVLIRWLPHAGASVFCLLVYLHLCATQCGTFIYYQKFLGVDTALLGAGMHASVALLVAWNDRVPGRQWLSDGAIAFGIGTSIFFAGLLAFNGSYCSGCVAAHVLMLVQLLAAVIKLPSARIFLTIGWMVAGIGAANLAFHHRAIPATKSPTDQLLAFLRTDWTGPRAQFIQGNVAAEESPADNSALLRSLLAEKGEDMPVSGAKAASRASTPIRQKTAPVSKAAPNQRTIEDANLIGQPSARTTLKVHLDAGCPKCAQQVQYLTELNDLIGKGDINVRLFISGETPIANALTTTMYAAGLSSPQAFQDTVSALFGHNQEIAKAEDIFQILPLSFPADIAQATIMGKQKEIELLMTDTLEMRNAQGITGTPTIIIENNSTGSRRVIPNMAISEVLRIAVSSQQP